MFKKTGFIIFLILFFARAAFPDVIPPADSFDLGMGLYAQGQYRKAQKLFTEALKSGGHRWKTLQALGDCCVKLKQNSKALDYYRQSLKLHPNNPILKAYVRKHAAANPALPVPNPGGASYVEKKTEFSFSWGLIFPFQTSILNCTTIHPWQASLYLGAHPSPGWACGIQVDYIDFMSNGADPGTPADWKTGNSSSSGVYQKLPALIAGNISINGKFYILPTNSTFPLYVMGGGGLFVVKRQTFITYQYQNSTNYYAVVPGTLMAGPSFDWGLGVPIRNDENSKALIEFRVVNAFADQQVYYGSLNVGALFFF
jgi:hypothetical protein